MHFDLTPLYRTTVGFDRLARMLDSVNGFETSGGGYPPYNIERVDENQYRITMAVAGFGEDELTIEVKEGTLTIAGQKQVAEEGKEFLHQGIAARNFERRFQLADHVEVSGARLENGLLHVELKREIPEAMKPRTIPIAAGDSKKKTIEQKAA
jgi:molecular chaperone IbpA